MSSDSGHLGRDRKDKVVPLGRHTFVAEIEENLSEARRLFSLHHYRACELLVREVLRKDPQNPKAKALFDLTTIKLSAPQSTRKTPEPPTSESFIAAGTGPDGPHQPFPTVSPTEGRESSPRLQLEEGQSGHQITPGVNGSFGEDGSSMLASRVTPEHKESLRERTISALVDLFHRKDMSLADWKDPRFRPDDQRSEKTGKAERNSRPQPSRQTAAPLTDSTVSATDHRRGRELLESSETQTELETLRNSGLTAEPPPQPNYQQLVAKKFEERSEDLRKSEIRTVSIAQIKKYLYQEEYELCAQELENIRKLFPENEEIQVFVENTFRRLTELQRIKNLEHQAKDLITKATGLYQEGKLLEALSTANEVLRLMPNHREAREFLEFVNKRLEKERKKAMSGERPRYCWHCGVAVELISRFCFHCGQRLT
jgi:hypothetical protein